MVTFFDVTVPPIASQLCLKAALVVKPGVEHFSI
jgi:hypothetical protein